MSTISILNVVIENLPKCDSSEVEDSDFAKAKRYAAKIRQTANRDVITSPEAVIKFYDGIKDFFFTNSPECEQLIFTDKLSKIVMFTMCSNVELLK